MKAGLFKDCKGASFELCQLFIAQDANMICWDNGFDGGCFAEHFLTSLFVRKTEY